MAVEAAAGRAGRKDALKVEIDHFIDCIQNGTECITGIDHAKKVVEILSS